MAEFLQSYGIWIIFSLLCLFMPRGHGHGMGCGMGGHQHNPEQNPEAEKQEGQPKSEAVVQGAINRRTQWTGGDIF